MDDVRKRQDGHDPMMNGVSSSDTSEAMYTELPPGEKDSNHMERGATYQPPGHMLSIFGKKVNSIWLVTHILMFMYASCFFIQGSTMPYLTRTLSVDPVVYGYLETTFAIMQLIGGPLFGRFGDIFGGRAAFLLAFVSAATSFIILGMAHNIPMLFLSKLPSIFMHANQAGSMVITDISRPEDRSSALGTLGVMFGVGMVVGPLLSGQVTSRYGHQSAPLLAAALCVVCMVLTVIYIPAHTKRKDVMNSHKGQSMLSVSKWAQLLRLQGAIPLLTVKTLLGLPMGAFHAMFSVMIVETFKLEPHQNGYMMSYVGILIMLIQGIVIGGLAKKVGEMRLVKFGNFVLIFAWLMMGYVTSVYQWAIVAVPHIFGMVIQMVVLTSVLTKIVPPADTGAMMGLNMAGNSVVRMIAPSMGGFMMQVWGFVSLGYLGASISIIIALILELAPVKVPQDTHNRKDSK